METDTLFKESHILSKGQPEVEGDSCCLYNFSELLF